MIYISYRSGLSTKACRIIAALLTILGVLLLLTGTWTITISTIGENRYEKTSGKLVRAFSSEDQSCYDSLQWLKRTGKILLIGGILVAAGGAFACVRPRYLLPLVREKQPGNG